MPQKHTRDLAGTVATIVEDLNTMTYKVKFEKKDKHNINKKIQGRVYGDSDDS